MRLSFMVCALAVLPALAGPASGTRQQDVPPIPGVTSAVAIEGTVDRFYNGVEAIAVKASDGVRHLFRVTKRTAVHGAGATAEAVDDLEDGTHVVVHYTGEGTDRTAVEVDRIGVAGLREMRGVLAELDRGVASVDPASGRHARAAAADGSRAGSAISRTTVARTCA